MYKKAVESVEQTTTPTMTAMIKLTNPFIFVKKKKETEIIIDPNISWKMRQRWENFHILNGTWYDYSDDGSGYSDDEYEDEIEDDE